VLEDGDFVGEALDLLEVLRREDDRSAGRLHGAHELPEAASLARIERRRRLVEQEDPRFRQEGDRDVQTLLVSDRQLGSEAVGLGERDRLERPPDRDVDVVDPFQAREEDEVLPRGKAAVLRRALWNPADVTWVPAPSDRARIRREGAREDGQQRRLARPVRPHEGQRLASANVEVGRFEGRPRAVAAGDAPRRENDAVVRHGLDATTVRPYDREAEIPANRPVSARRRQAYWEWDFEVDGALALAPVAHDRLIEETGSDSLPRMAWPEAPGLAARAALREEERARVKRARRAAAIMVVAAVTLVLLLLPAFGSSDAPIIGSPGPAPAQRLLPSGPPRPLVVAVRDTLRIQLPINQGRVTAIGYHAAGASALELEPVGTQANAGVFGRIVQRLVGGDGSGIRYYMLEGGAGPRTGGLDIGAPVGTDVFAPVDGTVIAISSRIINGRQYGKRIEIQPSGNPSVVVAIMNVQMDPALNVGSPVVSARTKIGSVLDLSAAERAALARYTQDEGQHVHLEVHAAASIASP
jgi:murein DD-endopeptidase MepM/ murein hydrolase activator NlpD